MDVVLLSRANHTCICLIYILHNFSLTVHGFYDVLLDAVYLLSMCLWRKIKVLEVDEGWDIFSSLAERKKMTEKLTTSITKG